jgi:ADP-ribose pyrophosphatase YjhB (NUDIX family)
MHTPGRVDPTHDGADAEGAAEPGRAAPVLDWARELATMAQTALTYARDPYDVARYTRLRELALEMMAVGADAPLAVVRGVFDGETGHATPKVDVRAVVCDDAGRVLLVRERRDGGWTLPGGWADVGETPAEAVAREVEEEAGYRVRVARVLAVWDKRCHDHPPEPFYVYKLVFLCEVVGGAPRAPAPDGGGHGPEEETDGVGFFAPDALPPLSLPRITAAQVRRLCALAARPDAPTAFD